MMLREILTRLSAEYTERGLIVVVQDTQWGQIDYYVLFDLSH